MYRGGLNGHVLVVDACSTQATPTGATTCAVQLANDKVAAALVPLSAEDSAVFNGLAGSGIPYFTYTAASSDIILKPGANLLTNPIGLIAAPAKLAKDAGITKAGYIIIDVPAATGPITAIANPIFKKAGVTLDVIPISPQVADMTPQIQQAISSGDKEFAITGTDEFVASAVKALKQLGFPGQIVLGAPLSQAGVKTIPGGIKGVLLATSVTSNPTDKDVQLYNAILATYNKGMAPDAYGPDFFATVMAFDSALDGRSVRGGRRLDQRSLELDAQIPRPAHGRWHHLQVRVEAGALCTEHLLDERAQGHLGRPGPAPWLHGSRCGAVHVPRLISSDSRSGGCASCRSLPVAIPALVPRSATRFTPLTWREASMPRKARISAMSAGEASPALGVDGEVDDRVGERRAELGEQRCVDG